MEIEGGLLVFVFFFLFLPVITFFQIGNSQSTSQQMPLTCILDKWKLFDPLTLRRSRLKCFCTSAWPQYPMGDEEHWPEDGTLNYNRNGTSLSRVRLFATPWTVAYYAPLSMGFSRQ